MHLTEVEIKYITAALAIREYAESIAGRERLAIEGFLLEP